jgi:3-dehydroquinate synthase
MYPGETRKNLRTALGVYNKMARTKTDRGAVFVTVGGGVVTELGGFIASTYKEGLKLFHVPTSLVAQLDVGIAGKTGLNISDGKNFVATSYSPAAVFIDPSLIETLPKKEYQAGLAEAVKYGMVREAELLTFLEENLDGLEARTPLLLEEIVYRCASIKAAVEQEAQSSNVNSILRYGSTVGRALQAAGGFTKIHQGEALAVGMEAEAWMAEKMGIAGAAVVKAQNRILRLLDLPTRVRGLSFDKLFEVMEFDPKPASAWPRFALPESVGHALHNIEVPLEVLQEALKSILLSGGRIRAVRPMAPLEETEEAPAAAEVPPPPSAN